MVEQGRHALNSASAAEFLRALGSTGRLAEYAAGAPVRRARAAARAGCDSDTCHVSAGGRLGAGRAPECGAQDPALQPVTQAARAVGLRARMLTSSEKRAAQSWLPDCGLRGLRGARVCLLQSLPYDGSPGGPPLAALRSRRAVAWSSAGLARTIARCPSCCSSCRRAWRRAAPRRRRRAGLPLSRCTS